MIQFNLTEQQADIILNALGHRPFLEVNGLIGELMKQAQEQQRDKLPEHLPQAVQANGAAASQ